MARETKNETKNAWRCEHHSSLVVESTGDGKRARCLGCGGWGPVREGTEEAVLALREEAQYREEALRA
jgi:hypothetical protein